MSMKATIRAGAALVALVASTAGAQDYLLANRAWSIYGMIGGVTSTGGGSGTLMEGRYAQTVGLRFRIEEGPWWFGVEYTDWVARATTAGFDSIAARDGGGSPSRDRSATFNATSLQLVGRRDLLLRGPLSAYALLNLGATQSEGHITGKCFTDNNGFPLCTEPARIAHGPGMTILAAAGAGVTIDYSSVIQPIPKWIRWVLGKNLMIESTVMSQEATEGRFTAVRGVVGIGW
jgi:hypothetical protein